MPRKTDPSEDAWGHQPGDALTPELTAMRLLGGGSRYEAWLAFDEVTYGPVVVKLLRPSRAGSTRGRAALRREVDVLESIRHPVVVRALRHDLEATPPHVVLEHIEGPRLSALVRRHGRLGQQQYLPLGIELASAAHYLRHLDLVHLDLKPGNVVMGAPARLIDLSSARTVDEAASLDRPVGTRVWMAPEQCLPGAGGVPGPASDVWGIGVTLHHAISGVRPFDGGEAAASDPYRRHPQLRDDAAPLGEDVPAEVREVVRAALAREPADRPAPHEIAEALEPALARQPRPRIRR